MKNCEHCIHLKVCGKHKVVKASISGITYPGDLVGGDMYTSVGKEREKAMKTIKKLNRALLNRIALVCEDYTV